MHKTLGIVHIKRKYLEYAVCSMETGHRALLVVSFAKIDKAHIMPFEPAPSLAPHP